MPGIFHLTPLTERRATRKPKDYVDAFNTFNEKLEKVLAETQKELLGKLGVEEQEFDNAVEAYMREGNQELYFIHLQLPHKMK